MIKKSTIIITLFITVFFSCKKYEEGPYLSLYSKEHRVVGTWTVESFFINGVDSTTYLTQSPLIGKYIFEEIKHNEDEGGYTYSSIGNEGSDTSLFYTASGRWSFSANKNNIFIRIKFDLPTYRHFNIGPFGSTTCEWEIKRLKEKEMWLYTIYSGREFYLKLKQ